MIVKHMRKWFENLRIQKKLLLVTLGISLTVLLLTSFSMFYIASQTIMDQSEKQMDGVLEELILNLDSYFDSVENSFDYITTSMVVQEELRSDQPYSSDGEEYHSYNSVPGQIRRLLLQVYSSVFIRDIRLIGYNGANHILTNGSSMENEKIEEILELAENGKGKCIYYNDLDDENVIYIARQIRDTLTMEPLGVLMAAIKVSYFSSITDSVTDSFSAETLLLDEKGQKIVSTLEELPDGLVEKILGGEENIETELNGQTCLCFVKESEDTGFIFVGILPMNFLRHNTIEVLKMFLALLTLSILLCFILAFGLAREIAQPIEQTSIAMTKFADGDFDVRLPERGTDEIGTMNAVFNDTIVKVQALLKKIVEMEVLNKDIEFQALQAQINPHFLYNVLDTVNWMARKKGEENICRMVTSLSNLMRGSISNKKSMVTIEQEIQYVSDYIYIQETRYQDKFTSWFEIDPELNSWSIPKMTIQILVENAVVHGVENATWDCLLMVTGHQEGDRAVFVVKDDGIGIPADRLQKLINEEELPADRERSTHIGIAALKKRLEYVYQGEAEFHIASEAGKGTEATLVIPLRKEV